MAPRFVIAGISNGSRQRHIGLGGGGGGGVDPDLFITEWTSAVPDTFTMPTTGTGYNGTVTWKDSLGATVSTGAFTDGDMTPLQAIAVDGVNSPYTCEISGDFPRVFFSNGGDRLLITDIQQWGDIAWASLSAAFWGCTNITISATDSPDLSASSMDLSNCFRSVPLVGVSISSWSMATVISVATRHVKHQKPVWLKETLALHVIPTDEKQNLIIPPIQY